MHPRKSGIGMGGFMFRLLCALLIAGSTGLALLGADEEALRSATSGETAALESRAPRRDKAAAPADLTEHSTLQEYIDYAMANNPGLMAAFSEWQAELQRLPQVRALPDPGAEARFGPSGQSYELMQMLPWFGKLRLRSKVTSQEAGAARQRYEAERRKLAYDLKDAYYEHYYSARAIDIVGQNRELVRRFEEVARARYRVAAAEHSELVRAQVELGYLDDMLRTTVSHRTTIVARLNAILNRPPLADLPWPRKIQDERTTASEEQMLTWYRTMNPQLLALDHEIAKEQHSISLAKKEYFPDVELGIEYMVNGGASMMPGESTTEDALAGIVSVNIPLWFGKYRGAVREASARHQVAVRARSDRENMLASEIKMVLFDLRDSERKMDLYRDSLLPKARESVAVTETAYRAGKVNFLELLDSQRMLLELELAYERALTDHAQRLAELDMLVGLDLPRRPAEVAAQEEEPEAKEVSN